MGFCLPRMRRTHRFMPKQTDLIAWSMICRNSVASKRAYELDVRPLNVSSIVRTVTQRLTSQAESKRISLDLELAPDLPRILADDDRAVQVLTNLTGNAMQYTPEGGKITISAKRINRAALIATHGTGIGFLLNIWRASSTVSIASTNLARVKVVAEAGSA